jgi:enoyl-CoA hydratase
MGKALELVLTARVIRAEEAESIGLVNRVVAAEALLDETHSWAAAMAEMRPEVFAAAKRALQSGARSTMAEAMKTEQRESAALRAGRG